MKRSIKVLALLLALALVAALAACGTTPASTAPPADGGASTSAGGDTPPAAGGPSGNITFFYWDEFQKPGMDAVVEMYQEATGVSVETSIIPWAQYWTQMQTSLPTANGPDVFWCNSAHAVDYYPAGLVEPLTPFIERDGVDMTPFPTALQELYTYDGQLYGLPKDFDTIGLFYNKAMFDAKSVEYPTNDWTWDDLLEAAIALTDDTTFGFISEFAGQTLNYSWALSNNGTLISEDNTTFHWNDPGTIESVQWLMDLINVHGVSPTGAQIKELESREWFLAERVAMMSNGNWNVPVFYDGLGAEKLGVARLPIPEGGRQANVIHGLSFNISAQSQNKEAAWGLVKTFSTQEAGEAQAAVVIPAYGGATEAWMANFPELDLQIFIDAAEYADPIPTPTIAAGAQTDVLNTQLENIWIAGTPVEEALAALDEECAAAVTAAAAG